MPLILAIEPDRRQAAQLSVVVRKRVHAELILVDTTEQALDAIGNRMPDLVLVPALLSPQDDAAIAAALRVIAAAAHVQLLTIPVLGAPRPAPTPGGVLSALRRGKPRGAEPDGCDPAVFAEQVASYLERAARERPEAFVEPASAPPLAAYVPQEAGDRAEEAPVTVDDAFSREWLESLPADTSESEPAIAAVPDESVSAALEEAVRALFADPAPAAPLDAEPEARVPARAAEPSYEPSFASSYAPETVAVVAAAATDTNEWPEVDELIAALHVIPLSPIETAGEDEWIASPRFDVAAAAETSDIEDVKASGGKSEREWVALIESLRHDVERLRVERTEKSGRKAPAALPVRAERNAKPVQDEWGFFDPQQCGFAALLAKLDEVTESDDGRVNR
jgi:hypothetical protein